MIIKLDGWNSEKNFLENEDEMKKKKSEKFECTKYDLGSVHEFSDIERYYSSIRLLIIDSK